MYCGTHGRLVMGCNIALPSGNSTSAERHAALRRGEKKKRKKKKRRTGAGLAKYDFWILH